MTQNMGSIDRGIRLVAAAFIAVLFLSGSIGGTLAIILAIVAGIFVVTSAIGWCPLYTLVGVSTRKASPATRLLISESGTPGRSRSAPATPAVR